MEPLMFIVLPGFLGGLLLAFVLFRLQAPGRPAASASTPPITTELANISSIRVAGIGGLGLVAMAMTVAWFEPTIRMHVGIGVALGAVLGLVLILARRRRGLAAITEPRRQSRL